MAEISELRVLEDGEQRVTEDGEERVTEGVRLGWTKDQSTTGVWAKEEPLEQEGA